MLTHAYADSFTHKSTSLLPGDLKMFDVVVCVRGKERVCVRERETERESVCVCMCVCRRHRIYERRGKARRKTCQMDRYGAESACSWFLYLSQMDFTRLGIGTSI